MKFRIKFATGLLICTLLGCASAVFAQQKAYGFQDSLSSIPA